MDKTLIVWQWSKRKCYFWIAWTYPRSQDLPYLFLLRINPLESDFIRPRLLNSHYLQHSCLRPTAKGGSCGVWKAALIIEEWWKMKWLSLISWEKIVQWFPNFAWRRGEMQLSSLLKIHQICNKISYLAPNRSPDPILKVELSTRLPRRDICSSRARARKNTHLLPAHWMWIWALISNISIPNIPQNIT